MSRRPRAMPHGQEERDHVTISVVIATYNRANRLDACLAALSRQAFEPGDGIVVADNGSTDHTAAVLSAWAGRLPGRLRAIEERRPGKSIAIASAVADCRADVLAFTDDDVKVADDWVASIRRIFANRRVALAGGPVLPDYEADLPAWLDLRAEPEGFNRMASPLGLLDYGARRQPLGPRAVLGANLAVRRHAFEAVGGFPRGLGKLRGTLLAGEDHQLCERVQAAGFNAVYDPSVVVRHLVPADRLRAAYFVRWFFWSGVTHAIMDRDRPGPGYRRRLFGIPAHFLKRLAVESFAIPGSLLLASRGRALEHSTLASFAAGYAWAARQAELASPIEGGIPGRVEAA